jgi:hypothetical protein
MISTINQAIQAQGGVLLITGGVYWSSFEYDTDAAWVQDFSSAFQHDKYKTDSYLVRAVRAF